MVVLESLAQKLGLRPALFGEFVIVKTVCDVGDIARGFAVTDEVEGYQGRVPWELLQVTDSMVRREMGEKLARINWNGLVDGERPRKSEMVHGVVLVLDGPALQG